jgi:hypothetical protein
MKHDLSLGSKKKEKDHFKKDDLRINGPNGIENSRERET